MKRINSNNIFNELWELLGMFESKSYVCEKVAHNFKDIAVEELNIRIDIITSSVRQAREYFKASEKVSFLTSPLLVNYGMINLAKALYYLKQPDISKNYFSKHGADVCQSNYSSIVDVKLKIKEFGSLISLGKCYNEKKLQKEICLKTLLAQIPEISQLYEETYNTYSKVLYSQPIKYGYKLFSSKCDQTSILEYLTKNSEDIFSGGIIFSPINKEHGYILSLTQTMAGNLTDNIIKTNKDKTYVNIEKKDFRYNQITISYLTILAYSMLVRYYPNNWEKFIDKNFSKEYQIISKSVLVCKEIFIMEISKLIIDDDILFINEEDKYVEAIDLRKLYRDLEKIDREEKFLKTG